jgi:hypothetical protein
MSGYASSRIPDNRTLWRTVRRHQRLFAHRFAGRNAPRNRRDIAVAQHRECRPPLAPRIAEIIWDPARVLLPP